MTTVSSRPPRPAVISVIVGLGMLGSAFLIGLSLLGFFMRTSLGEDLAYGLPGLAFNPYLLGIMGCISATIFWGLSNMRRWAAYSFAGWAVLNQAAMLGMGHMSLLGLVIPLVILACIFTHFKKMV